MNQTWHARAVETVITAMQRLNNVQAAAGLLLALSENANDSRAVAGLRQQQQQQPSSWRTGLLLSCFKALMECLQQRSMPPMRALLSVTRLASKCTGLGTLADN